MTCLRNGLVLLVVFAASSVAAAADAATQPTQPKRAPTPPTALQVAQRYAKQLKDGDPVDAVRRYWDLDAMLESAFGDNLKNVSAADRQEMKRLMLVIVERVHANAILAAVLSQATLEGFRSREHDTDPKTATVNYYLVFRGERVLNTILMRQSAEHQWHIVDAGAFGRMIVPGIRKDYSHQVDRLTPLEFMQDLVTRIHPS